MCDQSGAGWRSQSKIQSSGDTVMQHCMNLIYIWIVFTLTSYISPPESSWRWAVCIRVTSLAHNTSWTWVSWDWRDNRESPSLPCAHGWLRALSCFHKGWSAGPRKVMPLLTIDRRVISIFLGALVTQLNTHFCIAKAAIQKHFFSDERMAFERNCVTFCDAIPVILNPVMCLFNRLNKKIMMDKNSQKYWAHNSFSYCLFGFQHFSLSDPYFTCGYTEDPNVYMQCYGLIWKI